MRRELSNNQTSPEKITEQEVKDYLNAIGIYEERKKPSAFPLIALIAGLLLLSKGE